MPFCSTACLVRNGRRLVSTRRQDGIVHRLYGGPPTGSPALRLPPPGSDTPDPAYYTQGRVTSRQPRVAVRELCLRAWQQGGAPLAPRRLLHGSKLLLRSSCRRLREGPGSNIIGGLLAGGVYSDPPYCGVPCEARDICSRAELCRSPQRKAPVFAPNSAEHGDAT